MKKLLLPLLLFFTNWALVQTGGEAQTSSAGRLPHTSISVSAGPNWLEQFSGPYVGSADYSKRTGYTVGAEVARRIAGRWQFRFGLRYNVWESTLHTGPLTWPSENVNGTYVYDPSLPHYLDFERRDKAWQYLAGLRYLGGKKRLQWNADLDLGATDFVLSATNEGKLWRATVGVGVGASLRLGKHFALFAQPSARYIFRRNGYALAFMPLQLEMGARWNL